MSAREEPHDVARSIGPRRTAVPCAGGGEIGTYWAIRPKRIFTGSVVTVVFVAWVYRRHRRALQAYGVEIREAKQWKALGLAAGQAKYYQSVGPAFVARWLASGFVIGEMDELVRHKISVDEAVAWRRSGMSVDVTSEWGRYRLSPDDVHAWGAYGFRARAAYVCKSIGLTPQEAAMAYERGEHPAFSVARKVAAPSVTLDLSEGWTGPYPPRDAPPDALLSWDDDEDGPKVEWWVN